MPGSLPGIFDLVNRPGGAGPFYRTTAHGASSEILQVG